MRGQIQPPERFITLTQQLAPPFFFFLSCGFHMPLSQSPRLDFAGLLLSRQNDKSTPPQTDSVDLDHHLRHTWNYSAWPCVWGGNRIQVNREAWDNRNACFFFFPSLPLPPQPCICKLPLCLLHWICARRFHPPLRLTAAHEAGLFFFSIPSPCSPSSLCSLCPSEFPGDFISAISNRIGAQFSMLHVTLPPNIRTWYGHIIKTAE